MAAVVELALQDEDAGSHATLAEGLSGTARSRLFGNVDLKAPLTQKHWQAARDEFLGLRRDALNVESLHGMLVYAPTARRRPADSGG
jgi:hypothetical protein